MIYGYSRVSSFKQLAGFSLEEQERDLKASGAEEIVWEQYTGKTMDRPKLNELISKLEKGDTLVATKLDRLSRNVKEGIDIIDMLLQKGVIVRILNMGTIENTPMGKLIRTVLLAMAEFERDMIIERTQAGKELAKQKPGFRDGRPPIAKNRIDAAMELLNTHSYSQVEVITGISKATLCRAKRKRAAELVK